MARHKFYCALFSCSSFSKNNRTTTLCTISYDRFSTYENDYEKDVIRIKNCFRLSFLRI